MAARLQLAGNTVQLQVLKQGPRDGNLTYLKRTAVVLVLDNANDVT